MTDSLDLTEEQKKYPWPTLAGRLRQPLTSRKEALLQMKANGDILTEWAEKYLQKLCDDEK